MPLNCELLSLRHYHKAKNMTWEPVGTCYERDKRDWAEMTARERRLIQQALTLSLGGETYAARNLAPLLTALRRQNGRRENGGVSTGQLFEESKHVAFFIAVLEEVVGQVDYPGPIAGSSYRVLFETELAKTLSRLLTDHSPRAQVDAVIMYHLVIKGMLAETAYHGVSTALCSSGLMPVLVQGLALVRRDEARHTALGLQFLTRLASEDPALWPVIDRRINALFPLVSGIFMELLEEFLPDIPFDLDLNDWIEYADAQYTAHTIRLARARESA